MVHCTCIYSVKALALNSLAAGRTHYHVLVLINASSESNSIYMYLFQITDRRFNDVVFFLNGSQM